MTTPITPTPVVVDYTNRDFTAFRSALISRVQARVPNWSGNDASDFGVALIEAFSYMGDIVSYYTDRVANENNILTATQRSSILALSRDLGYNPPGYLAATTTIQFSNTSASPVTLPLGTEVSTSITTADVTKQVIFNTLAEVTVPANGVATISARHGDSVLRATTPATLYSSTGELLGYSDGTSSQIYRLHSSQVSDNTLTVSVKNGDSILTWTPVLHLSDYGPNDAVYTVQSDANNTVSVIFGDGVSGGIPQLHAEIRGIYEIGGGIDGNISANQSFQLLYIPGVADISSYVSALTTITNTTPGTGGIDPELDNIIRVKAPRVFSTINRAVSLRDYSSLALQEPTCSKSNSSADIWTSVTVYAAPAASTGNFFPLYDSSNTYLSLDEWVPFHDKVAAVFTNKSQVGVTITVAPPTYVPVFLNIRYTLLDGYTDTAVEANIRAYMETYFSYNYMGFQQTVRAEDIEAILSYVVGIRSIHVETLVRYKGTDPATTTGRDVLVGAANEIFVFNSFTTYSGAVTPLTKISQYDKVTSLTSLVVTGEVSGALTLSPTFTGAYFNYAATAGSSDTYVTVTPTASTSPVTEVIRVNGTVVPSASASGHIDISSGVNTITVNVTAEDGVTTGTYTVNVTKA
jgi:hypothetical protein